MPPGFLLPGLEALSIRTTRATVPTARLELQQPQRRGIRSIQKPPPKVSRFDQHPDRPSRKASAAAALARKLPSTPPRPGLLGYKREMSAIYDPDTGHRHPVTIVQLDRNQVVAHKTREKHGYIAACMGCGARNPRNISRPQLGHYASQGVNPKRHLAEFRVASERGLPDVGTWIEADWFNVGQFVDARARCRGMGFAGGMKRHGFAGQDASHGASLSHRSMGSAGQSQGGGSRVYPGKRMPGRMGGQYVTVQNLEVVRVDKENGLVVLAGALPGPERGVVQLSDARKKPWPELPAAYQKMAEAVEEVVQEQVAKS